MTKVNANKLLGVIGAVAGTGSLALSVVNYIRTNKMTLKIDTMADNLNTSVEDWAKEGVSIDIPDSMIQDAINSVVDDYISEAVSEAAKQAAKDYNYDISRQVKEEIDRIYPDIKKSVTDELAKQVGRIRTDKLQDEVIDKVKEEMSEKLDKETDRILESFNTNLESIAKIYNNVSSTLERSNSSNKADVTFKVI